LKPRHPNRISPLLSAKEAKVRPGMLVAQIGNRTHYALSAFSTAETHSRMGIRILVFSVPRNAPPPENGARLLNAIG
jgi:hypothetical protein